MKRLLLAPVIVLVLAAIFAGCGGGEQPPGETSSGATSTPTSPATAAPTSPNPAPRVLTPADDGRTYTMSVGQVAKLVVSDPEAPDPEVHGTSVLVVPVVNITASGQREWELCAIGAGTATIRGQGTQPYVITLEVVEPRRSDC